MEARLQPDPFRRFAAAWVCVAVLAAAAWGQATQPAAADAEPGDGAAVPTRVVWGGRTAEELADLLIAAHPDDWEGGTDSPPADASLGLRHLVMLDPAAEAAVLRVYREGGDSVRGYAITTLAGLPGHGAEVLAYLVETWRGTDQYRLRASHPLGHQPLVRGSDLWRTAIREGLRLAEDPAGEAQGDEERVARERTAAVLLEAAVAATPGEPDRDPPSEPERNAPSEPGRVAPELGDDAHAAIARLAASGDAWTAGLSRLALLRLALRGDDPQTQLDAAAAFFDAAATLDPVEGGSRLGPLAERFRDALLESGDSGRFVGAVLSSGLEPVHHPAVINRDAAYHREAWATLAASCTGPTATPRLCLLATDRRPAVEAVAKSRLTAMLDRGEVTPAFPEDAAAVVEQRVGWLRDMGELELRWDETANKAAVDFVAGLGPLAAGPLIDALARDGNADSPLRVYERLHVAYALVRMGPVARRPLIEAIRGHRHIAVRWRAVEVWGGIVEAGTAGEDPGELFRVAAESDDARAREVAQAWLARLEHADQAGDAPFAPATQPIDRDRSVAELVAVLADVRPIYTMGPAYGDITPHLDAMQALAARGEAARPALPLLRQFAHATPLADSVHARQCTAFRRAAAAAIARIEDAPPPTDPR